MSFADPLNSESNNFPPEDNPPRKICPFMSTSIYGDTTAADPSNNFGAGEVDFIYRYCEQDRCQLWDDINKRCGALTSDVQIHVHNQHKHPFGHKYQSLDNRFGDIWAYNSPMTKASFLLNEFINKEDLDGDGQIYGYDFQITDDTVPVCLKYLPDLPEWPNPGPTTFITWDDYITSVGG